MKHFNAEVRSSLVAATLLLLLLQLLPTSTAAIQCSNVLQDLAPCASYLMTGNGSPSSACCSGVSSLVAAASTTADRRAACGCIQSAAPMLKPNAAAARALSSSCGVNLPSALSPNVDCSKIS